MQMRLFSSGPCLITLCYNNYFDIKVRLLHYIMVQRLFWYANEIVLYLYRHVHERNNATMQMRLSSTYLQPYHKSIKSIWWYLALFTLHDSWVVNVSSQWFYGYHTIWWYHALLHCKIHEWLKGLLLTAHLRLGERSPRLKWTWATWAPFVGRLSCLSLTPS